MVLISIYVKFDKKKRSNLMLHLNGCTQAMKAAEKYQYLVRETIKCLDQYFVCHVDNQCYKSYTHSKNLKKARLCILHIFYLSLKDIAARQNKGTIFPLISARPQISTALQGIHIEISTFPQISTATLNVALIRIVTIFYQQLNQNAYETSM